MLQFITNSTERYDEISGAKAALEGGCRWIQLRMKNATDEDIIRVGKELKKLCADAGATFILNDRPDLAARLDADGVHLGKEDISPSEARKIMGEGKIIGATANTLSDILNAIENGADYIGLGPFRFTTTKKRLSPVLGLEGIRGIMTELRKRSDIPVVAIGGIEIDDIPQIMTTGVTGIAISGTILNSPKPETTTEIILKTINHG